jgi:surface polysaccharide O-acyltransferase-like enzyme
MSDQVITIAKESDDLTYENDIDYERVADTDINDNSEENTEFKDDSSIRYDEIKEEDEAKGLLSNNVKTEEITAPPKKSKRVYWADCARIFSMLAILFLHSAGYSSETGLKKKKDPTWIIICVYNCITRFGVPVFVLLSGTFILDPSKKFSFKKLFRHNIFRLATAFIFWSTMNALCHIYVFKDKKPNEFLKLFIVGEEYLWFIYMIIGCYLIAPFLRLFSDDIVLARYFLLLSVIWGSLIPTIKNVLNALNMKGSVEELDVWINRWHYHFTLEFVGYFVAGYHIVKHVNIRSVFIRLLLYLIGIADVVVICYFTIVVEEDRRGYIKYFRDTYTFTVAVYSVILFIFFKHEIGRINFSPKAIKMISKLSNLTFGVYLSHMIIKRLLTQFLSISVQQFFGINYSPIIGCPIYFVIVTILSFGLSYLISITPILNKYIM